MNDEEYFARRLKEQDFAARGFTRDAQVSGGYTENHFGRGFGATLNFTIYYEPSDGRLSMYSSDPTQNLAEAETKIVLLGVFVFTPNELDFVLNRCAEYQVAIKNHKWTLQRPPIAGDEYHSNTHGGTVWGGEQRENSPLQIAIQHGLPIKGDLVWKEGRKPTVEFAYNPNGRFEFDRYWLPFAAAE